MKATFIMMTCFWLLGCGSAATSSGTASPAPDESADHAQSSAELPETTTECFAGTGTITLPSGQEVGKTEAIARRTVDPAAKTITEEFVALKPRVQRFVVTIRVDGNKFEMTETGGAFKGTGELVGEPWEWTSWTSRSELPDGTTVVATDTRTANGIEAQKNVMGPDGNVVVSITEVMTLIGAAECEERFAALPQQ